MISGEQLISLGLTQDDVDYRASIGRLRRLHRGVFALDVSLDDKGEFQAAVLAAGAGAMAGGLTSLALWDIRERRPGEPAEVTVARDVRIPGVHVRCVAEIHPRDISKRHGIPVLMPAPALLEAATVLDLKDLRRTVNQALVEKRVSIPSLVALVARSAGRRGVGRLARVLASAHPTRSDLEDALVAYLHAHGVDGFETNARIGPDEVDVLLREQRVVVEADGGAFHDNPIARANDAAKQARLEAQGYLVLRVRWTDLTNARLRNALQTAAGSKP